MNTFPMAKEVLPPLFSFEFKLRTLIINAGCLYIFYNLKNKLVLCHKSQILIQKINGVITSFYLTPRMLICSFLYIAHIIGLA